MRGRVKGRRRRDFLQTYPQRVHYEPGVARADGHRKLERTTVGMVLLERTAVGTVSVVPASALPEIFEPIGRQLGVAHRMLDVPMPEIGLQGSRIVPLVGQREAAGMRGWARKPSLAARRHVPRAWPDVENGDPRSDVNTNGDFGSCSRCSRRSARISSPRIGWVLGVPLLTRRTCKVA